MGAPQYLYGLLHHLVKFTFDITLRHFRQRNALDLRALAFAAKFQVALLAQCLGRFTRRFDPLAGVKLFRIFVQELARGRRHGQPDVRVDVDLAHAVLDGFLNL